ncbi:hypothetical protein EGM51_12635 [Verrucomicrobia bacterium S94]|nr:hypothetical protein EGM51_02790 [Verrucomicrobia bacterium S94]QBG48195.1 hypothetical protein EGM51_12635 [Verrucomicrobia bacterium S94]
MESKIESVLRWYKGLSLLGFAIGIAGLARLVLEIDQVPEWSRVPVAACVSFTSLTAILGAVLLFRLSNKIKNKHPYHLCVKRSYFLLLFIPLGLLFGIFSIWQLRRPKVKTFLCRGSDLHI